MCLTTKEINDLESQNLRLSKLDGLIKYFNKKFFEVYDPERELAVDENMCSWSGNGGSKVYMPLKPIKYGMKIYAMCESRSGYACSIIQYSSKNSSNNVDMLKKLTEKYRVLAKTGKSKTGKKIFFFTPQRLVKEQKLTSSKVSIFA